MKEDKIEEMDKIVDVKEGEIMKVQEMGMELNDFKRRDEKCKIREKQKL